MSLLLVSVTLLAGCNEETTEKTNASSRSNSNKDDDIISDLAVSSDVRHTNLFLKFKYDCKEPKKEFQFLQIMEHNYFTNGIDNATVHQLQWVPDFEEESGTILNVRTLRLDQMQSWQIQMGFLDSANSKTGAKSNTLTLTGADLMKEATEAWEGGDSYEMLITAACKDGNTDSLTIERSAWIPYSSDEK